MAWREIIYQYDGSFEGLLCCVFESYTKKERPTAILRDGDDEPSLFEIRAVTTDRAHAQRIYRSLYKRSPEVGPFLRRAFLTCLPDKEMAIYRFEVNRADYEALLRVPGIGVVSAKRILVARRSGALRAEDLKKLGVVMKRAQYFLTCGGRYASPLKLSQEGILQNLMAVERRALPQAEAQQLSLFDQVG